MDTIKEKIARFISGKFSFSDYLSVTSFFRKEEFNEGLKDIMEDDWSETDGSVNDPERLNLLLNRLHQRIGLNNLANENPVRNLYRLFSKIAAVLLLPALITIVVLTYVTMRPSGQSESWAEIYSPVGSRTKFQLPDGSQGWLNGGSTIKYPVNFSKLRTVEISGEAWFDVVHLEGEPFRVITPSFDVKVMGTQFDVMAYANENTAEVILERGRVLVLGKDQTVKGELLPDQQLIFNKATKIVTKTAIDSKSYTSWKDGLQVFKNVTMSEMARRLERKYNTEILLHGDSLKSSIFRATFQDENLDEICKMLATVAPIRYKIYKRKKLPDNTFAKGKVEMWLKTNSNYK